MASSRVRRQLDVFEGCGALIAIVVIAGGFCQDAREDGRAVGVWVDGYPAGRPRRPTKDEFVERGPRGGLEARVPCPCSSYLALRERPWPRGGAQSSNCSCASNW